MEQSNRRVKKNRRDKIDTNMSALEKTIITIAIVGLLGIALVTILMVTAP